MPVSSLVFAVLACFPASIHEIPGRQDEEIQRVQRWGSFLSHAFEKLSRPIAFDIDAGVVAPEQSEQFNTVEGIQLLAAGTQRSVREAQNTLIFARPMDTKRSGQGRASLSFYNWLKSLGPEEQSRALKEGLTLNDIPVDRRADVLRDLCVTPSNASDLMTYWSLSKMRVSLEVQYTATGSNGKVHKGYLRLPSVKPAPFSSSAKSGPHFSALAAFETPNPGIDYGNGQVVRLRDIVNTAKSVYRLVAEVDDRLLDTWIFMKGGWDKSRLAEALTTIGTARKVLVTDEKGFDRIQVLTSDLLGDLSWLYDHSSGGMGEALRLAVEDDQPVSASVLESWAGVPEEFQKAGLELDTAKVRLIPRLIVYVDIPGSRPMEGSKNSSLSNSYGVAFP